MSRWERGDRQPGPRDHLCIRCVRPRLGLYTTRPNGQGTTVKSRINKLANPDFSQGKNAPRNWVWTAKHGGAQWRRGAAEGITLSSNRAQGSAYWSQVAVCKPGKFYRIESTATCALESSTDAGGLVLQVEALVNGRPRCEPWTTPSLRYAAEPIAIRTYFKAPQDVRRVRVSVGVVDAVGTARIGEVRMIAILEPDEVSHVLAVPPPTSAYARPRTVQTVCVCSDHAAARPLTRLLSAFFGDSKVRAVPRGEFHPQSTASDALFLPDPVPPPSIRSLEQLFDVASQRLAIVSLPAFAKLTRGVASLRRIEQWDDPIHAKITYADYATPGFALNDTFAYAWGGRTAGSFVQNQFRRTEQFKNFCRKHGLETMLVSMCEKDVTSDRPICLYKPTADGGLFVLDVEPLEAPTSTFGEPNLGVHLLLSILGVTQVGLGQYTVPLRDEPQFRDAIRETGLRCEQFVVYDADVPVEEVDQQLVTIGGEDRTYGLPLEPKPVILVRSGLTSGDVESVYGAYTWFKHLIRPPPFACTYGQTLASRFRLAWVPSTAPWAVRDGWRRANRPPPVPMELEIDDAPIAALIDLVSCPVNRVRVLFAREDEAFQNYAAWMPQLSAAFAPGSCFAHTPADGETFDDRRRFAWRRVRHEVQVVVAAEAFAEPIHRDALAAGGNVLRIEVPGCDADFTAHSIHRTALAATLLEQVVGLQYGIIAVNRSTAPVHFDGFPPVGPGEPLIVNRRDPILRSRIFQVG